MLRTFKKTLKRSFVQSCLRRRIPLSLVGTAYELPLRLQPIESQGLTSFDAICNFNFDDLCPMYDPVTGMDYGGRLDGGLLTELTAFLEEFPEVAMTFFVVPDYRFSRHWVRRPARAQSCNIAHEDNAEWLHRYKALAGRYKVEYAVHGYRHYQDENPFFASHTEFAFKTLGESREALIKALACFTGAGLRTVGFRQPGWDLASDLNIIPALHDLGFKYICASSTDGGFNAGRARVSNIAPTLVGPIVNLPQNIGLDDNLQMIFESIKTTIETRGIVSIKGHFVTRGIPNALGINMWKLRSIATFIRKSFVDRVEHLTMAEVALRVSDKLV